MANYLKGFNIANSKLKQKAPYHWKFSNEIDIKLQQSLFKYY